MVQKVLKGMKVLKGIVDARNPLQTYILYEKSKVVRKGTLSY